MTAEYTPTPWKYTVNVGPTKALIVEADGSTIFEVLNSQRSSRFERDMRTMCRAVNSHEALVKALERLLDHSRDLAGRCNRLPAANPENDPFVIAQAALRFARGAK